VDAHSHAQRLVSVAKWGPYLRSVLLKNSVLLCVFGGEKDLIQSVFIKKYLLFAVRRACRVKRFSLIGKRFSHDEDVQTEVRKWLRQQSKDFFASGIDAVVKQWDKCISGGGGYVEK
jgi:hypothetical protein